MQAELHSHGLKRSLGRFQLTMLGIGSIVGAGIYVMTGMAASVYAGPAILVSFVVAGLACLFTAFSYGELASVMPVSGSAYSYAYLSLGEVFAWGVGWLLLLEYGISDASVAAGFSGYLTSFLQDIGITMPQALVTPTLGTTADGALVGHMSIDLLGAGAIGLVTFCLLLGVSENATINAIIVVIKILVLLVFVGLGVFYVHKANFTPFIPPATDGFHYGYSGIFRAASIIFFAYVGFEAVSTASSEARNPARDVPFGIIVSLLVCTLIYMATAAVMVGVVPYRELNVADPLAIAVNHMQMPWLGSILKLAAVTGLFSVMLVLLFGQTRIFYAMSYDGLLPAAFSKLHPRFATPWTGTLVIGVVVALATAFLPLDIISDLVSLGTATAFGVVCFTVIWQRNVHPELERPFKVPLGAIRIKNIWLGITPCLGIFFCLVMAGPLLIDMVLAFFRGNPVPLLLLLAYLLIGILAYICYGRKHSRLSKHYNQ
ncbi:APC family permease [Entomobacter blattae]|nr:amino acid permease [Entomobacter blattae]